MFISVGALKIIIVDTSNFYERERERERADLSYMPQKDQPCQTCTINTKTHLLHVKKWIQLLL